MIKQFEINMFGKTVNLINHVLEDINATRNAVHVAEVIKIRNTHSQPCKRIQNIKHNYRPFKMLMELDV